MPIIEEEIARLLHEKRLTLGVVESATGGLVSYRITNVPGSSEYFKGAIIAYSNEIKIKVVGVKPETINNNGAVCGDTAEEMAAGGRKVLNVDICVADTGIAGPGGATQGKPVGLFYLGLAHKGGTFSRKCVFIGTREQNKQGAAEAALSWVKEYLQSLK